MHISHPFTLFVTVLCLLNDCIASPLNSPPTLHLTSPTNTNTNISLPPHDYHPVIMVSGTPIFLDLLHWGDRIFLPELSDAIRDVLAWIDPNVRQHGNDAIPDGRFEHTHVGSRPVSRISIDFRSDTYVGGQGELTWQAMRWALNGFLTFAERDTEDWASREWSFDIYWFGVGKVGKGSIHDV